MDDTALDVSLLLVRELEAFQREIELSADEDLWRTAPGITNSVGNLALHVAGNLQHFVGAVLGGTTYVRDREVEFARRSGSSADVIAEIQAAVSVVKTVVPRLPDNILRSEYPQAVNGVRVRTDRFLLHLCTHTAYHLGQAGYLRRLLSGEDGSVGAVALSALVARPTVAADNRPVIDIAALIEEERNRWP